MKNTKIAVLAIGMALAVLMLGASAVWAACNTGDKGQVLWKGTWYPATVLKANGDQCFIHYNGYGSNWDEWVGPDRIRLSGGSPIPAAASSFSEGDAVKVLWKGTWYDAHVLKNAGTSRWKIHYDGYDNSWDEVVGPDRIKSR